jgi:hypothetical protein
MPRELWLHGQHQGSDKDPSDEWLKSLRLWGLRRRGKKGSISGLAVKWMPLTLERRSGAMVSSSGKKDFVLWSRSIWPNDASSRVGYAASYCLDDVEFCLWRVVNGPSIGRRCWCTIPISRFAQVNLARQGVLLSMPIGCTVECFVLRADIVYRPSAVYHSRNVSYFLALCFCSLDFNMAHGLMHSIGT